MDVRCSSALVRLREVWIEMARSRLGWIGRKKSQSWGSKVASLTSSEILKLEIRQSLSGIAINSAKREFIKLPCLTCRIGLFVYKLHFESIVWSLASPIRLAHFHLDSRKSGKSFETVGNFAQLSYRFPTWLNFLPSVWGQSVIGDSQIPRSGFLSPYRVPTRGVSRVSL